eukprot:4908312-Pleurochrysis_carterae.AAC.1
MRALIVPKVALKRFKLVRKQLHACACQAWRVKPFKCSYACIENISSSEQTIDVLKQLIITESKMESGSVLCADP